MSTSTRTISDSLKSSAIHEMSSRDLYKFARDFGLGCGIDATKPKPWEEKRSYRVCNIQEKLDNVIITDEGGNMHAYRIRVESQHEIQGQLTSSIALPNTPVTISAGAEISRKSNHSCEIEGRKLVDCKLSIRPDSYKLSSSRDRDDFEVRVSSWIMDYIDYHASVEELVRNRVEEKKSDAEKEKDDQGQERANKIPKHVKKMMEELDLERSAAMTVIDLGLDVSEAKELIELIVTNLSLERSAVVKLIELDRGFSEAEKLIELDLFSAEKLIKLMGDLDMERSEAKNLFEVMAELGLSVFKLQLAVASAKHKKKPRLKPLAEKGAQKAEPESNKDHMIKVDWSLLVDLCEEFVRSFNVTHYVSAIELGASEFQVVEETTEENEKSAFSSLSLSQIASATAKSASKWRKFSKSTDTRKLGFIRKGGKEIERLAVLDVSVLPITHRLRTARLQLAMRRALNNYIDHHFLDIDKQFKKGPFKIVVQVEKSENCYLNVYWNEDLPEETKPSKKKNSKQKLNQRTPESSGDQDKEGIKAKKVIKSTHRSLQVTSSEEQAAPFFLIPVEGKKINEFYIVYYNEQLPFRKGRYIPPTSSASIPYYLQADLDLMGQSDVGLKFVANPSKACRFRFKCSRCLELSNRSRSSILKFAQSESFYIKCPKHRGLKGYVRMCKLFEDFKETSPEETSLQPTMGIASSKATHNPPSLCFLFKLIFFTPSSTNLALHGPDSVCDASPSDLKGGDPPKETATVVMHSKTLA